MGAHAHATPRHRPTAHQVDVVRRELAVNSAQVAALPGPAIEAMLPILRQAQLEVANDLERWLSKVPDGKQRYTAQMYRNTLLQLRNALRTIAQLEPTMFGALVNASHLAGGLSVQHLQNEVARFSEIFDGTVKRLPLNVTRIIATSDRYLIPRHRTSAARYAGQVGQDIRRELAVGVIRGESVSQMTDRLQRLGGPRGHVALQGVAGEPGAVTERIGEGLLTRYRHWAERVVRTECLTGDTVVDSAVVRAVFRRWYNGEVFEIRTGHGRKFTTTPNHPMLTQRGWVSARHLCESDYLVCDARQQDFSPARQQNINARPTAIGEIFDTVGAVSIIERERTSKPDFHGDGIDGYVDILRVNRALTVGAFATLYKPVVQALFAESDQSAFRFCHFCSRLLPINERACCSDAANWFPGGGHTAEDQFVGYIERISDRLGGLAVAVSNDKVGNGEIFDKPGMCFAEIERIRPRSGQASAFYNEGYPTRVCAESSGHTFRAKAGDIEFDRVVSLRSRVFEGHVYNLETPAGYFTISGAYTGNTLSAYNTQLDEGLHQARKVIPDLKRRLSETEDKRTCKLCASLDGSVTGIDQPWPGGFDGPPIHPNCRGRAGAWRADWPDILAEAGPD
jgi:hypothetical protein